MQCLCIKYFKIEIDREHSGAYGNGTYRGMYRFGWLKVDGYEYYMQ